MTNYYDLTLDDGISGDDVNRHLREKNLGYLPPSKDWLSAGREIRCLWPGQIIHNPTALGNGEIRVHSVRAYFQPLDKNGVAMIAPIRIVG